MDLRRLLSDEYNDSSNRKLPKFAWLATTDSGGRPRNRTIILRQLEWQDNSPVFSVAVDRTSDKVKELLFWSTGYEICWYVVDTWTQYRMRGQDVKIIASVKEDESMSMPEGPKIRQIQSDDEGRHALWSHMGAGGRKAFCDIALLRGRESLDAAKGAIREMAMPEDFCVLKFKPNAVEILRLFPDLREADVSWLATAGGVSEGSVQWKWSSKA